MSDMLLNISELSLHYGSATGEKTVLDRVNLHIAAGETVGLVGESGSGKSSTVRAALRLLAANARVTGSALVNGAETIGASSERLRRIRSGPVSLIQQDPRAALNPVRRIGDSLSERLIQVHGVPAPQARARGLELLRAVGISRPEQRLRQYPHELSGGMLQRVVIAAALTTEPALLLADEATSALDVTTQAEVLAILREQQRARGLGVLFITHDLHLASAYCDRVYVMFCGVIVEELAGAEMFYTARHPYTTGLLSAAPSMPRETR